MPTNQCAMLAFLLVGAHLVHAGTLSPFAPSPAEVGLVGVRKVYLADAHIGQDQAAEIAKRSTGGKVLGVRPVQEAGNKKVYEVKVLSADGRVILVRVDSETGAILQ